MTSFPIDRAVHFVQHTEVKPFRQSLPITFSAASKDLQAVGRPKRQAARLQAVKEKAGEAVESAKPAEQSRKPPNIFRRAVQALRPEPEDTDAVRYFCLSTTTPVAHSASLGVIWQMFATLHPAVSYKGLPLST